MTVMIDKELYRKTYQLYQKWNDAELVERIRNSGRLRPHLAWEQYADLWGFCIEMSPQPSALQLKQRFSEWQKYYSRIRMLEEWKRRDGKHT